MLLLQETFSYIQVVAIPTSRMAVTTSGVGGGMRFCGSGGVRMVAGISGCAGMGGVVLVEISLSLVHILAKALLLQLPIVGGSA